MAIENIDQASKRLVKDAAVQIASGQSLSGAIDLSRWSPVAIQLPAAWTPANVTFQASHDDMTFADVYEVNGEVTYPAAAGRYLALDVATFAGMRFLKVRSGTAATPVNQAAARTLVVILRDLG